MTASCEGHSRPLSAFYQSVLSPHPSTLCEWISSINVRVARPSPQTLEFTYAIEGDLGRVRWPRPTAPRRAHGLWTHTCLEAFVTADRQGGYLELNFSPSGEWACYAFTRYRQGMAAVNGMVPPAITVTAGAPTALAAGPSSTPREPPWVLATEVRLDGLTGGTPILLGLAAVIEDLDGRLSYWALRHPANAPDFHHPDAFTMRI